MQGIYLLAVLALFSGCGAYYYDYYVFALQWPGSLCPSKALGGNGTLQTKQCLLANNITSWTIHGLWPSVNVSYPNFCNDSWVLDEREILPLEDIMRAQWPSFDGDDFIFWTHEWTKHGTCASLEPMLYGPYNYFKFILQLLNRLDVFKLLGSKLILPTNLHCYNYTTFAAATKAIFNESIILGCTWDPVAKQQHIAQIEICLDKKFSMNCNPDKMVLSKPLNDGVTMPEVTPCYPSQDICYFPLDHSYV